MDVTLYVGSSKNYSEKELKRLCYRFSEASDLPERKNPLSLSETKDNLNYYKVNTYSRLYSECYARGHWPEISMAITWLRSNFQDAVILYGGDTYHIDETPVFTIKNQQNLTEYWCKHGGTEYRNRIPLEAQFKRLCPHCDVVMSVYSSMGTDKRRIVCLGCKFEEETIDNGKTWSIDKKDWFDLTNK